MTTTSPSRGHSSQAARSADGALACRRIRVRRRGCRAAMSAGRAERGVGYGGQMNAPCQGKEQSAHPLDVLVAQRAENHVDFAVFPAHQVIAQRTRAFHVVGAFKQRPASRVIGFQPSGPACAGQAAPDIGRRVRGTLPALPPLRPPERHSAPDEARPGPAANAGGIAGAFFRSMIMQAPASPTTRVRQSLSISVSGAPRRRARLRMTCCASGDRQAEITGTPAFMIPAFSAAISAMVEPSRSW